MGMDGLSMSNTGILREASSLEQAAQSEDIRHRDENNKQVDKMQAQVKVKEDGRNSSGKNSGKKKEEDDDNASVYDATNESENEIQQEIMHISEDDLDNHSFYVKITKDGETFELYDKESNRLVEKISAQEINQLMLKLNMASGILVNRSV